MSRIQNKQIEISTDFDINSKKLTNVAEPVINTDGVNKAYVDDTIADTPAVIGEAEDGDYTDGLFKDFDIDTEIGIPIDRFNEVLGALAPPPAPNLTDYSGILSGDVSGNLSFDSTYTISGYVNADELQGGINPGISRDNLWSISGKRLGVIATSANNDITGILNHQVVADSGSPNPSYPDDSFGDGDKGNLNLYINGVLVDTIDIESNLGAQDSTSGNTVSGFIVSAATSIKFPSGSELDLFQYRTGSYRVVADDVNLQNGYNWIVVEQDLGTVQRILTRWEFIMDDATDVTTFSANSLSGLSMSGSKYLSGVEYYTNGTAIYTVTISNLYKNTYSDSNSAISFIEGNGSIPNQAIPVLGAAVDNDINVNINSTFTISSGIRLIDDQISAQCNALRTVQATQLSPTGTILGILMDDTSSTSTMLIEDFNGESYRLKSNNNYDTYGVIVSNTWDSSISIADAGPSGYSDGLQVIGGDLVYPDNSSYPGDFSSIVNGPVGNLDLSGATGTRVYYRYVRQISPTVANFVMNIQGSGGTFVSNVTALTGNNIQVYIKAPGAAVQETGWLDAYENFATGFFNDNDGGRNAGEGAGRAFNTNWGLTIGTKNTANTDGYMLLKIVVGSNFTGIISGLTFTYS
jgi:hypothetical protein